MFQSAMPTTAACDAATGGSWPPSCKLKQMLGKETGLLLHNGGAGLGCGTRVRRCSVKLLKIAERKIIPCIIFVCRNMKHPMGVKNRQDEKKSD